MKNQIKELVDLIPQVKKAAKQVYSPSCGHRSIFKDESFRIYFADGYETFGYYLKNIEITEYNNKIAFKYSITEKDLEKAIEITKKAIQAMLEMDKTEKQKQIDERRQYLLTQLELLK
jgi:hypothetical protein